MGFEILIKIAFLYYWFGGKLYPSWRANAQKDNLNKQLTTDKPKTQADWSQGGRQRKTTSKPKETMNHIMYV